LKFFFLIAFCINLPFGFSEVMQVQWAQLGFSEIGQIIFVVVATTFLTYLFNIFALKQLSPSTVGVFIYLQPVVATIFAILFNFYGRFSFNSKTEKIRYSSLRLYLL
jgi:drug/metabolite transporter (DMT)-like permease